MDERWRLKQHGIPVAWAEGLNARREIAHYSTVYSQDGPVDIERRSSGRWRRVSPDHFRALTGATKGDGDGG